MPPVPGTDVGSYRIEAELGHGGMGVVFRALDTRLDAPLPSSSCRARSPTRPRAGASSTKPRRPPRSTIRTSSRSTTSANSKASSTSSPSSRPAARCRLDARDARLAPDRRADRRCRRRPGDGARGRHPAPRHQAREHPGHQERLREARRLRAGEADENAGGRRDDPHRDTARHAPGRDPRDRRVHVAGAGNGRTARRAQRRLLVRRRALRAVGRPAAVRRRRPISRCCRRSSTSADRRARDVPAALRMIVDKALEKKSGRALSVDARSRRGPAPAAATERRRVCAVTGARSTRVAAAPRPVSRMWPSGQSSSRLPDSRLIAWRVGWPARLRRCT